MARVSIFYDKTVKEQFFMVRGDERYARSTKTVIGLGGRLESKYGFCQEITVKVLRDVGTGNIVLYDNDEVITVIDDWNSESGERTIQLNNLNYNIDHNIRAEYIGNNQCSPSNSNIITFNVTDSHRPVSTLTFDNTRQYNPNTNISKTITLSNTDNALYNDGMDIEVYYDDVLLNTVTTDNGVATITVPTGDIGVHTLKAVCDGSDNLLPSSVTQTVSVGYNVEIGSYPVLQVDGNNYDFVAVVKDCFNNPVPSVTVELWSPYISQPSKCGEGTTDSNGRATINGHVLHEAFNFRTIINSVTYTSKTLTSTYFTPQTLTTTTSPRLYKNKEGFIQYNVGQAIANVPIAVNEGFDEPEIIYTNNQGIATKQLIGTGEGKQVWQGRLGNIYKETMIDDFAAYYGKDEKVGWTFDTSLPINEFNNYFQFYTTSTGTYYFTVYNQNGNKDYIFKMYDVISMNDKGVSWNLFFVKGNGEVILIPSPNYSCITVRRDAGVVSIYMENSQGEDVLLGTATGQDNAPIRFMMMQKTNFSRMELIEKPTYEVL